jgi:hypothetical protein
MQTGPQRTQVYAVKRTTYRPAPPGLDAHAETLTNAGLRAR